MSSKTLILLILSHLFLSTGMYAQISDSELIISEYETMRPHNLESDAYNELWTYHITLNNGYHIIYAFTITDFGSAKDRATGLKFQTTWKNGNHYVVRKEYDPEDLVYDSTKNLLKLHPERPFYGKGPFEKEHNLHIKTSKDGVDYFADFTIYDTKPSMIWGDGTFEVDGKKVILSFPIPHGKVEGDIAINGDTLKNISGTVYMDHLTQTDLGVNIFESGYRINMGNGHNGLTATLLKPLKSDTLLGYGIEFKNGIESLVIPKNANILEKEKIRGNKVAKRLRVEFENRAPLTISIDRVLYDYSILDELGGFKKFFAKRILGGELIQFNGYADTDNNEQVIFNYFIKN